MTANIRKLSAAQQAAGLRKLRAVADAVDGMLRREQAPDILFFVLAYPDPDAPEDPNALELHCVSAGHEGLIEGAVLSALKHSGDEAERHE